MNLENLLYEGSEKLGVVLDDEQIRKFINYLKLIKQWNTKVNLTSITDEREIVIKHFLDSISVSNILKVNNDILDIGAGGGFPGIPFAIVNPDLNVTLLDSSQKKVVFMKEVIRNLELENAEAFKGRAEDRDNTIKLNSFGIVVTRAVGNIKDVLDLSLPYINNEGKVVMMRGKEGDLEWAEFVKSFGGEENYRLTSNKVDIVLPFSDYKRVVLIISK